MFRQLVLITFVCLGAAFCAPPAVSKVAPGLLKTLLIQGRERASVVVSFEDTAGVLARIESLAFTSQTGKTTALKAQLEELQANSQKNAIAILSRVPSIKFKSFWINNKIYIRNANLEIIEAIAELPEVAEIREEVVASIGNPIPEAVSRTSQNNTNEWSIEKIEADKAWEMTEGNRGEGIVVSIIDTGVRATHEALRNNYRTPYGWFDPADGSEEPSDEVIGHGTHVAGTAVGTGGIGVAPGAQFIACRGCQDVACYEEDLVACGQWITCPTLTNGSNPDCSKTPRIASNSWGGPTNPFYKSVVTAWHSAGIIPVFAQGNEGPECETAHSPGDYENVIAIGGTDWNDILAQFSSRGPAWNGTMKPDLVAPGQGIRSAFGNADDAYATLSGTSMATPAAAGTLALVMSHRSNLLYFQYKEILMFNADQEGLGQQIETCGGTPPHRFPNNMYGHGRLNARRSLQATIDRP